MKIDNNNNDAGNIPECPRPPENQPIPEPRDWRMDLNDMVQPDCPSSTYKRRSGSGRCGVRRSLLDDYNVVGRQDRIFPPLCLSRYKGILPRPFEPKARRNILKPPLQRARPGSVEDPTNYMYGDLQSLHQALSVMNIAGIPEAPGAPTKSRRHQTYDRFMPPGKLIFQNTDESGEENEGL
ncbi:hypothetical protein ElyMa_004186300 [Elysia marginata]|uniref:Uncharacterized protein n=1 Tax=Elysia marginata TaxID=1093978 RepID=A0AAV4GKS9_9GAST|nr:hypothetical protein ElyMa_004186300 [Elysia marginata]